MLLQRCWRWFWKVTGVGQWCDLILGLNPSVGFLERLKHLLNLKNHDLALSNPFTLFDVTLLHHGDEIREEHRCQIGLTTKNILNLAGEGYQCVRCGQGGQG